MANAFMKPFLEAGYFISYMNYAATGEGVTSWLAVGGSALHAETELKEKLPDFFHQGIVTAPIDIDADDEVKMMIKWIPDPAMEILRQLPLGTGHYVSEIHYNLS